MAAFPFRSRLAFDRVQYRGAVGVDRHRFGIKRHGSLAPLAHRDELPHARAQFVVNNERLGHGLLSPNVARRTRQRLRIERLGVTVQAVRGWESGRYRPKSEQRPHGNGSDWVMLAQLLGGTVEADWDAWLAAKEGNDGA